MSIVQTWDKQGKSRGTLRIKIVGAEDINDFLKTYERAHPIQPLKRKNRVGLRYNLSAIVAVDEHTENDVHAWDYGIFWVAEDGVPKLKIPIVMFWVAKDLLGFLRTGNILSRFKKEEEYLVQPELDIIIGQSLMIREEMEESMIHRSGIWEGYCDFVEMERLRKFKLHQET